jgi:hypothetical protein
VLIGTLFVAAGAGRVYVALRGSEDGR